jgi:hypothetical protein
MTAASPGVAGVEPGTVDSPSRVEQDSTDDAAGTFSLPLSNPRA